MAKDWTIPPYAYDEIDKAYRWYALAGDCRASALSKAVENASRKFWQIKRFRRFDEKRRYSPEARQAYDDFISQLMDRFA